MTQSPIPESPLQLDQPRPELAPLKKSDVFLMTLLIYSSGNNGIASIVGGGQNLTVICFFIFLITILFRLKTIKIRGIWILLIFFLLEILHCLMGSPILTSTGAIMRIGIACFVANLFSNDFFRLFTTVMVWITKISLFFWLFSVTGLLTPDTPVFCEIPTLFNLVPGEFLFYKLHLAVPWRNCGIFWEPGAYAGYLILAMIFLVLDAHASFSAYKKNFFILTIGLLSTLSTTGYIAFLFFLLFLYLFIAKKIPFGLGVLVVAGCAIMAYYSFITFDFLNTKILREFNAVEDQSYNWELTRFGSMIFDLELWWKHPLAGYGGNYETIGIDIDLRGGMGNGMSDFLLKNGAIGFLLYFYSVWKLFMTYTGRSLLSLLGVAVISIPLQGECFLAFPIYLSLMFLPYMTSQESIIHAPLPETKAEHETPV